MTRATRAALALLLTPTAHADAVPVATVTQEVQP